MGGRRRGLRHRFFNTEKNEGHEGPRRTQNGPECYFTNLIPVYRDSSGRLAAAADASRLRARAVCADSSRETQRRQVRPGVTWLSLQAFANALGGSLRLCAELRWLCRMEKASMRAFAGMTRWHAKKVDLDAGLYIGVYESNASREAQFLLPPLPSFFSVVK